MSVGVKSRDGRQLRKPPGGKMEKLDNEGNKIPPWKKETNVQVVESEEEDQVPDKTEAQMVIERLRDQGVHEAVRSAEPSEDDIAASRMMFEDWYQRFDDQQTHFNSPALFCEMQYKEIKEISKGMKEPNSLKTAACSVLFDRLCSTFSRHDRLMVNLKDDIMQAVYQDYSPSVATENTYFDRFPYFLLYDEYLRKTNNMSDQIQNLLEQRNETILGSKVIRTTTERELERMQNLFKQVAWSAWVNFIHSKHQTIAVVKDRMGLDQERRHVRILFNYWKTVTLHEIIWKQSQELNYLEEQTEFMKQELEERPKVAVKEVRSVADGQAADDDPDAVGTAKRREQTLKERMTDMYWHADSNAVKAFPYSGCKEAMAEIMAQKVDQDKERDKLRQPRQLLPDFCRDYFLKQTGVYSSATKRLCEFILALRKHKDADPMVRIFGFLVNAYWDEDWDEHAASFVLNAVKDAVPAGLVLGRLLNTEKPTVRLSDAILASERALASKYAVGFPFVGIWKKIRDLSEVGLLETDLDGEDEGDDGKLVKLFAWLDVLLAHWREQLKVCKTQTFYIIEREQKLRPDDSGVLNWVRFVGMMREAKDDITDTEIMEVYRETADLTGRHQDKLSQEAFYEVCRRHCISYMGSP